MFTIKGDIVAWITSCECESKESFGHGLCERIPVIGTKSSDEKGCWVSKETFGNELYPKWTRIGCIVNYWTWII